ncbi:hypothetical protein B0F88_11454 [Methylobacter tundripaludum]|uniref:Uncharacterized protein n=1 Tax=Methylobacter tundripaludum TaxID=173365 RepID=A0A2S6GQ36_9GAMM|nr:hypothetical protein B0F88_11454 [Methylobacter tundripaludum]
MKILTVTDIQKLVQIIGLENFLTHVISALEENFGRWNEFILSPRHGTYYPEGVIPRTIRSSPVKSTGTPKSCQ